jgi:hypothetical protein
MPTIREIHLHVDNAVGDDPRLALIAVRQLLEDDIPWLERRAVQLARAERWHWSTIARLLLRSRQAVRQRHADVEKRPPPEFVTDDPMKRLNDEAEEYFRRARALQAAREAREAEVA